MTYNSIIILCVLLLHTPINIFTKSHTTTYTTDTLLDCAQQSSPSHQLYHFTLQLRLSLLLSNLSHGMNPTPLNHTHPRRNYSQLCQNVEASQSLDFALSYLLY